MMAARSPLVRQWVLLRTLAARRYGATVRELAADLAVSDKTIRRDLETFRAAGFPLEETVCDFGRKKWRLDAARWQAGMSFSFDEALALYLGRRFLEPLAGTLFWEAVQRAFAKIRATLGPEALKYLDKFAGAFHRTTVGTSDYTLKADLIDRLMIAIEDRRIAFLTYRSLRATEPVTYDVYPYGLTYHRGSLYLVGQAPQHNAIRHWKVDRIEAVELQDLRFTAPEGFDLARHFAQSFGVYQGDGAVHVKVRFSPTVARYVQESAWHASQRLAPQKDGALLAEFDLDGTAEIKRWILSFGKEAEVLEPEEFRRDIAAELGAIVELYATRPSGQRGRRGAKA